MNYNDSRAVWNIAKTLHKKSSRDETGLFLIEGHREIELARKNGIEVIQIFDRSNTSAKNMERISYCGEIVAVAVIPERNPDELDMPEKPFIIVLDNLEKPGNIGAIIRTADAAGVTAVLVCGGDDGGTGDLYNPNLIRSSLGAVFSLPVYSLPPADAAKWLRQYNIPVAVASPDGVMNYYEHDYTGAAAVVVGSEAKGVSRFWTETAGMSITIPMTGAVNSLNVSVSAAVLIYEAVRQRLQLSKR